MSYFTFLCFLLFSREHNRSGFPTGRDVSPAVIPAVFVAALENPVVCVLGFLYRLRS